VTCIVGIRTPEGCVIGGDSAAVDDLALTVRADPKVFNLGPTLAVGFTTSFRMGQILRFHHGIKSTMLPRPDEDIYRWVVKTFIPAARSALKEHGYMKISDNREDGGRFLLAVQDRLFAVYDDFQVGEPVAPFAAVGCGGDLALGALYALSPQVSYTMQDLGGGSGAESCIEIALKAAEAGSAGVRGPFYSVRTTIAWQPAGQHGSGMNG